jgi:CDGSH iron-sulfur domain-containing protein 3
MGLDGRAGVILERGMNTPHVCGKSPMVEEMEPGTYWWCSCGYSATQPFCDGSHKGKGFTPVKVEIAEKQKVAWCLCKQTKTPPFCDGSHAKLA